MFFWVLLFLLSARSSVAAWLDPPVAREPCSSVIIYGDLNPDLSETEKKLICGDPGTEAWRKIPLNQAQFHLKNFLQDRGYHFPVFFEGVTPSGKGRLITEIGEKTTVQKVVIEGDDSGFIQIERKRELIGKPLKPALLDSLEKWVTAQLRREGYACPTIETTGDPLHGVIEIKINKGDLIWFSDVIETPLNELNANVLRRFDAFQKEGLFNEELLFLTEKRVNRGGPAERLQLSYRCETVSKETHLMPIQQQVILGSPRLLVAGAGLSTESIFAARISWRNTRLDRYGSAFQVSAFAIKQRQSLEADLSWYLLRPPSRTFFHPRILFTHRNERPFQNISVEGFAYVTRSFDTPKIGMWLSVGPSLSLFRTLRGTGAPNSRIVALESNLEIISHDFDLNIGNQKSGYYASALLQLSSPHILSNVDAQRFDFRGEKLWNVKNYDPTLWILGVRGGFTTVITKQSPDMLPANYLQYLGGSANLRGFGRKSLPESPITDEVSPGGVSSAFVSGEARLTHTLPFQLDALAFLDVGAIGDESFRFKSPVYWSPGLGLRWASPVGPLRMTAAPGLAGTDYRNFQIYISFGEEF